MRGGGRRDGGVDSCRLKTEIKQKKRRKGEVSKQKNETGGGRGCVGSGCLGFQNRKIEEAGGWCAAAWFPVNSK